MPALAIEIEALGRVYRIRGAHKERPLPKEQVALTDVPWQVEQWERLVSDHRPGERGLIDGLTYY